MREYTEGLRVMTATYPIKPSLYAITLRHHESDQLPAERSDAVGGARGRPRQLRLHRRRGQVVENSNMNVAFVTADGVLRPNSLLA